MKTPGCLLFLAAGILAGSCTDEGVPLDGPAAGARDAEPAPLADGGPDRDLGPSPDAGPSGDVGSTDVGPGVGAVVPVRSCESEGRWCWVKGAPIDIIEGPSEDALYAAGRGGTFLRWTGDGWSSPLPVPSFEDITDVYVAGPNQIWVASDEVRRFDGSAWREAVGNPSCKFISGSGPSDIWIYGSCSPQHFNGNTWTEYPLENEEQEVYSILARGPGEAWASVLEQVTDDLAYHHHFARFDGTAWTQVGRTFEWEGSVIRFTMLEIEGEVIGRDVRFAWSWLWDGAQWVEPQLDVPEPDEGERVVYARQGGFTSVDRRCAAASSAYHLIRPAATSLQFGDSQRFCASASGALLYRSSEGWVETPYDAFRTTLGPDQWGVVPPQLWAHDAERAWGTSPTNVLRVQTNFEGGGELLSHYDGEAWRVVSSIGNYVWDIARAGGESAWILEGSRLRLFDGQNLLYPDIPDDLEVGRWANIHTLPSGETYLTGTSGGVSVLSDSLLVRYAEGNWSIVHRWPNDAEDFIYFSVFDDIGGSSADRLILAARNRDDERVVVLRDGDGWTQVPLGYEPRFQSELFALTETTIWLDGQERVLDDLSAEPLDTAPPQVSMGGRHRSPRLWVDPDSNSVWEVSRGKAMVRRLRP